MANPNMMATLGIGKKRPPMGGIPSFKPKAAIPHAAAGDTANPAALDDPTGDTSGGDGKISPEEVDYSANDTCGTCANMGSDGNCTKYSFPVEDSGHCEAGYEAKDSGGGSSSDLSTGPPSGGSPGGAYGGGGQ